MVYNVTLSTSISGGSPSGIVKNVLAQSYSSSVSNQDKVKALAGKNIMSVPLGKVMHEIKINEITCNTLSDYNSFIQFLNDYVDGYVYVWLFYQSTAITLGLKNTAYIKGIIKDYSVSCESTVFKISLTITEVT